MLMVASLIRISQISVTPVASAWARCLLSVFLALAVSGCAVLEAINVPNNEPGADEIAEERSSGVNEQPAPISLEPELIFDYLLADIAARRGDTETSMEATVRLAERTRDPDLIISAFRASMRGANSDSALAMAELLAETGGDSIRAAFAKIQALILAGKMPEVVDEIRGLLEAWPGERERIFNNAGELFAQQPTPSDYIEPLQSVADAYPEESLGYFAVAYLANRARNLEVLDRAINRALELSPNWEQAAIVKFVYLVQSGKHAAASEFAESFLERNPDAIGLTERHARLLAARGDMESAHRYFDRILEDQPENSDILMATALIRMQLENWTGARRLFLRHLKLNTASDQTRMHLARVATLRDRHEEAIRWYSEVRDEDLVFEAQLRISVALQETDGADAALDHLHGLIPVSREEEVRVLLALERILRDVGRFEEAHVLINGALQEIPDDPDLLYARGLLAAELNMLAQHEQDIRRVIEMDPENAHAYNALGYTLADQTDRFAEALDLIVRALELAPDDPFILDSMGWVQYRLGKMDKAKEYLRRALAIRKDPEIAAHLGEILWIEGAHDEATQLWDDALETDPGNRTLIQTLERLKTE